MARMIPDVRLSEIDVKSERDLAAALIDRLPADCLIIHSYPWLKESEWQGRKHISEGETDFLIIHPEAGGILVVETKGGDMRYNPAERKWFRPGQKGSLKDPFKQAVDGMHFLQKLIANYVPHVNGSSPFAFGFAVVFPDCDYSGQMPPGANSTVLFGRRDMPKLGEKLTAAIRQWGNGQPPLSRDIVQKIKQAVLPEFHILQVLSRKVAQEEETLIRLTDNQINILQMLAAWPQALIEGVAGSGKTLIAMNQARRFAEQGHRVLFTCYNRKLAAWLEGNVPDNLCDRIVVRHFHGLAYDLCKKAGIEFKIPEEKQKLSEFWSNEVPGLMLEAASKLDQTFDAIVVDEGQDFMPEWWDALHCLNDGGAQGKFYVFYDPAQNIYTGARFKPPFTLPPVKLLHNCRNTRNIAGHCGKIINTEIALPPGAPDGTPCAISTVTTQEEAVLLLQKTLDTWLREGLLPSQIAVLGIHSRSETLLKGKQKVGNCKISDDLDRWHADETVLFDTVRSFKGLEADAIVLFAIPEPDSDPHFSRADYYVAASRAKHILQVIELR